VVIDGTLIPIDRVAADRPFYSGKHRKHAMDLQIISSPQSEIVWVSGPLPGAVRDLTAARSWGTICELAGAGLTCWPTRATPGLAATPTPPAGGRNKPAAQKAANSGHVKLRAAGERANAQLIPEGAGRVKEEGMSRFVMVSR
jgi:hypothetical protein